MIAKVEAIPKMYAAVSVVAIVRFERCKNSKLDTAGITIFRNSPDDLDGAFGCFILVVGFHDFAESALAEHSADLVYAQVSIRALWPQVDEKAYIGLSSRCQG